eukprot:TRINITY_DN9082_c0_g2_i1.p1 TRINITY_DN9082_c0_g2~~TRINITY_DN9082_c0_g2_i1.p1  ORF type:complete len:568 (-),score=104.35 TRINITY_DN9082_c0_g2_i1:126-1829(-)
MRRLDVYVRLVLLALLSMVVAGHRYKYVPYLEMLSRMKQLAVQHPDLLSLSNAQSDFGLPPVGECGEQPCHVWILRLSTSLTDPRPRVFISGALHGDEKIGPTVALELVELLLKLHAQGDKWVQRLLATRHVVVMPAPNAVGYHTGDRLELGKDPNRDFGFDQESRACMTTTAARAINELFIQGPSPILLSVTFHGGDNLIGFAWGDEAHQGRPKSPDHSAMQSMATAMKDWAGGYGADGHYKVGTMTDTIYAVRGGMEDWAYGGSWAPQAVQCRVKGYPTSKTRYDDQALRCPMFLVETAMDKDPHEGSLGGEEEVFLPGGAEDGHVPRNLRIGLLAIDLAEPYIVLEEHPPPVLHPGASFELHWRVGGATFVDQTTMQVASGPDPVEWSSVGAIQSGKAGPVVSCRGCAQWGGARFSVVVRVPDNSSTFCVRAKALVDASWFGGGNHPESHIARLRGAEPWHTVAAFSQAEWVSEPVCAKVVGAAVLPGEDQVVIVPAAQLQWEESSPPSKQHSDTGAGRGGENDVYTGVWVLTVVLLLVGVAVCVVNSMLKRGSQSLTRAFRHP